MKRHILLLCCLLFSFSFMGCSSHSSTPEPVPAAAELPLRDNTPVCLVPQAQTLASDCYTDLDVISNIYHYVTQNITYDTEKASHVTYGYIPDPDDTLLSGQGICFDYASQLCFQ